VADAQALLASPKVPVERRRWYALLLYTGLRVGEAVALRGGDVDLRHGVLYVARAFDRHNGRVAGTKTGRPRAVPLEPALVPLVRRLCEGEGSTRRPTDTPLLALPYSARRARRLQADLVDAGVQTRPADGYTKALRVHDLRAAYITWCLARGDALVAVRDRVGHASFTMTEKYVRAGVADRDSGWFPPLPDDVIGGEKP
jgi:integrase